MLFFFSRFGTTQPSVAQFLLCTPTPLSNPFAFGIRRPEPWKPQTIFIILASKKKSHSRAFQAETSWTASAGAVGFRPWCQNYLSVVQCAVNCAVVNNHQSSFPNFPLKDPGIFRTAHIPPCSPSEAQYKPSNNFSPILSKYVIAATPLC